MTPAQRVIAAYGSASRVAKAIGRHRSTVCRWTKPRERGGTGGLVPSEYQSQILAAAVRDGLPLSPADLVEIPTGVDIRA